MYQARHLRSSLGLGVAVVLLALLLGGGFASLELNAAWAQTRGVVHEFGSNIFVTTSRVGAPTPAPIAHRVQYVETDIATLQEELDFAIREPAYLPDGFTLESVRKVISAIDGLGVELRYHGTGGTGLVIVTQSMPDQPIHVFVEQDRILQEVDINGLRGIVYDPGGPPDMPEYSRAILQWTDGARWFEIRGSVGVDEMTRMACSLAR